MNSERQLDDMGNSVSLFRSSFQSVIGYLIQRGTDPAEIKKEEFLKLAADEKKKREWYFSNDGVTGHDLSLYNEVMLDYLADLKQCLKDHAPADSLESCLHMLFH